MKRIIAMILAGILTLGLFAGCGEKEEHVHSFGEWTITKNPTCTEPGEQERLCSCGERQVQSIPEKGHSFGEWTTVRNATCTEDGEQESVCVCGEKQSKTIPATGHLFGEWVVYKEATCTEAGEETRTCNCGEKQTQAIPAGHNFSEWTTAKAATCTEDGSKTRVCTKCEKKETKVIAATGHKWTNATCTEPKKCSVCGKTEGSALGHNGKVGQQCSRCRQTIYPEIVLPKTPIKVKYYSNGPTATIESLSYEFVEDYSSTSLHIHYTMKYTKNGTSTLYNGRMGFRYKLVDENNVVLCGHFEAHWGMSMNEKIIDYFSVSLDATYNYNKLKLIITDYD